MRQNSNVRSVLIIDESDDSREVLRAVLEPRGIQVLEADNAILGWDITRNQHPDVVVLDSALLDDESLSFPASLQDESPLDPAGEHASALGEQAPPPEVEDVCQTLKSTSEGFQNGAYDASLVVLGKLRKDDWDSIPDGVLAKPYHYGLLIRTIEELLEGSRSDAVAGRKPV